ncbi:MAG: glycosyltransferase family 9 protein [Planctomycetes bacterium]|jgi:heptosyltransferase-2|nr:glycosyltransferase family 9 protein [Planctomycetota bacterium]MBT4029121.1 glycosyltransferase family 9 protein [Planctomycetota bacterium]MBT4560499.1 glycosyltransferase family 9 protein [Planctomycetota bacterium]MBT5100569.1 glycosyltransferase family 9 protein [Planctomycetota bacterium]MBT5119921.1 glycosyltransferase family 9 protein [Planctomycetota bacterium]
MASPTSLIIRLPNPLGDVVMATPLLEILRANLPTTHISVAGADHYESLLEGLTSFDQYLPIDAVARRSTSRMARILSSPQADAILLLPNSWSSVLAARKAGIPRRIGRRAAFRSLFLTDSLPAIHEARPMNLIYAEMAAPLLGSIDLEPPLPRLIARTPSQTSTSATCQIAIAPGAAFGVSKQYPPKLIARAIQIAQEKIKLDVVLIGSPNEMPLLQSTARALQLLGLDSTTITGTLSQAKTALARADVLLTMDSGARHMAAALGTPQVVLYGPTHPAWSAHSLCDTTILRVETLDCLTCHKKVCPKSGHPCMQELDPAQVADAILTRISK